MAQAFYGGQIQEKYRGNLAAVVTHPQKDQDRVFNTFLYDLDSEEFIHLTGVGSIRHPNERVYIGISHDAGDLIAKAAGLMKSDSPEKLREIDRDIIQSYFLPPIHSDAKPLESKVQITS